MRKKSKKNKNQPRPPLLPRSPPAWNQSLHDGAATEESSELQPGGLEGSVVSDTLLDLDDV